MVKDFVESEAWKHVRSLLTDKIVRLADITTLGDDQRDILETIRSRKIAIKILGDWLNEVEGIAGAYDINQEMFRALKDEQIVVQY